MKNFNLLLKRLFLWALLSSLWVTLHAQVHVKGTIVDNLNAPVIGASILQKGTTNGTISDLEGNFTLTVPENSILVFFLYRLHNTRKNSSSYHEHQISRRQPIT